MQIFCSFLDISLYNAHPICLYGVLVIRTINVVTKKEDYNFAFFCQNIDNLLIIKVISCSNISACIFLKIFFMFEYKCMHLFLKTKCTFKYKCMHVYAQGYSTSLFSLFAFMSKSIKINTSARCVSKTNNNNCNFL